MPERDPSEPVGAPFSGPATEADRREPTPHPHPTGDLRAGTVSALTRGLKPVCLYVREDDWDALRQQAARTGESASSVVRSLIGAYLEAVGE